MMKQRSNTIILFGIAFFFIGGAIVALFLGSNKDPDISACRARGGVAVQAAGEDTTVCIDPEFLR
jgi:hypothetical protein